MPDDIVPAERVIDRAALDRVLARAAALQGEPAVGERSGDGEVISESRLVEIAREVGLDAAHIRRAVAEEQARAPIPDDRGVALALGGPAWSSGQRVVRGNVADTLLALERWMQREERMAVQRRRPDRITFERLDSAAALLDRTLNLTGRKFDLARAAVVAATVVPADAGRVVVRLDADQREGRRSALAIAALTGVGAAFVAAAWLFVMLLVIGIPQSFAPLFLGIAAAIVGVGGLVGGLVLRRFRRSRARVQLAIEALLDRLEHDGLPAATPSLLERLDRAIR